MREGAMLDGAPVAAIEAIAAKEMQGAGNVAAAFLGHHKETMVSERFAQQREELRG